MEFTNGSSDDDSLEPIDDAMMNELDELLGAYALDAVDPDEARRVEEYLADNPRAAAEVQEHREVASMLAFSGATAPEGVWDRITGELEGVDAPAPIGQLAALLPADSPVISSGVESGASSPAEQAGHDTAIEPAADNVVPMRRRRRVGTALLAAAAAVVVVGASVVLIDGRASAPDDPIASAYESARSAPGALVGDLVAEGSIASATGVLGTDGQGFVDASALPALAEDQTYQLWGVLAATGDVVSLGIVGARPGVSTFTVDPDVDVAALALTIEQSPGVVSDGNPDGAYVGALG